MSPPPEVSVVVPARDAEHLIGHQLAAMAEQSFRDFEVVVADNGSTDGTREVVERWSDRLDVRIVDAGDRPGVAFARNTGMAAARAEKLLFCDADDEADPGWVAALTAALDRDDIVGGHLEVEVLNSASVVAWSGSPTRGGLPRALGYLPYAVGANMGLTRALQRKMGGFEESYVGGHEEVDLAWRAQEAGFSLGFEPGGIVHYRLRPSLRATARQRFWYGRSYAQLYRTFRSSPVAATPLRGELRSYARLARSLPRDLRAGRGGLWAVTAAFTAGRLAGDIRYRVRCPL